MSLETRITALASAIANDVKALFSGIADLAGRAVLLAHLGADPARVPTGQHLGRLAFADVVGATTILRHTPHSSPGDVWREYVSDTASVLKVHGFDGVVRTIADFTAAQELKLAGISPGATANAADAALRDRNTHTGTQAIATVAGLSTALDAKVDAVAGKLLSSNDFTNDERVKLANIAAEATKNATDAALRDRGTHTGTQALNTVTGLEVALAARLLIAQVGMSPDQLAANQFLGALAFMDRLGALTPMQNQPLEKRTIWFEYVNDTTIRQCMRGDDGVVRFSNTELLAS